MQNIAVPMDIKRRPVPSQPSRVVQNLGGQGNSSLNTSVEAPIQNLVPALDLNGAQKVTLNSLPSSTHAFEGQSKIPNSSKRLD